MSKVVSRRKEVRSRRKRHIRKKVRGTADCPRLSVFRSLNHVYTQIVDDDKNETLLAVSDLSPELRSKIKQGTTKADRSKLVGALIAQKALDKGIERVVFDRGGFQYHGRIRILADAAREAGLKF